MLFFARIWPRTDNAWKNEKCGTPFPTKSLARGEGLIPTHHCMKFMIIISLKLYFSKFCHFSITFCHFCQIDKSAFTKRDSFLNFEPIKSMHILSYLRLFQFRHFLPRVFSNKRFKSGEPSDMSRLRKRAESSTYNRIQRVVVQNQSKKYLGFALHVNQR